MPLSLDSGVRLAAASYARGEPVFEKKSRRKAEAELPPRGVGASSVQRSFCFSNTRFPRVFVEDGCLGR